MGEIPTQNPNLPSGFISVEQYPESAIITPDILPWVKEPMTVGVVQCEIQGGHTFLLASAVGTHQRLINAAEALPPQGQKNANNMFYSRLQGFIADGHAPQVETLKGPATDFPIHVMRTGYGTRVYFAKTNVPGENGSTLPLYMRISACDKTTQPGVLKVISGLSARESRAKLSQ